MDVKTLSVMLDHVSVATTLDIYTHITDAMQMDRKLLLDQMRESCRQTNSLGSRNRFGNI